MENLTVPGRPLSLLLGALTLLTACGNPAPDAYALIDHVSEAERDFDEQHLARYEAMRVLSARLRSSRIRDRLSCPRAITPQLRRGLARESHHTFSNAVSTLGAEVQAAHVDFRVLLSDESGETAVFEGSVLRRHPISGSIGKSIFRVGAAAGSTDSGDPGSNRRWR